MKRSSALIVSVFITLIFLILLGLSTATQAGQFNLFNARGIDVEATAQAIQLQNQQVVLKATAQERFQAIQNQITQKEQTLDQFNRVNETEMTQLTAQLATLETQIQQIQSQNQQLQATVTHLQSSIEEDNRNHQAALATAQIDVQQKEAQLQQELQVVSDALRTALNNLNTPEAASFSSTPDANQQNSSGENGQNQPENGSNDKKEGEDHYEGGDD